jgi:hypothetical protein
MNFKDVDSAIVYLQDACKAPDVTRQPQALQDSIKTLKQAY